MLVEFGQAGWLGKARQQPEKVRAVWAKVRAEGALNTWRAVQAKLEMPIAVGYCHVGVVVAAAAETGLRAGQRVVSNAPHAEVVAPSVRLVAPIPDAVSDEAAAFTPLAAIALEGIDLLQVDPGDRVVVTGLGLIGQLAVRRLRGVGCEVLGVDPAPERRALAEAQGARTVPAGGNPLEAALAWTRGKGVAGVLITASAASDEIVSQAARSCRYRGRVVLVGVVGLRLNRADFYRNEVSFQVSCSYGRRDHTGPGSAQDNFRRVLAEMAAGRLPVEDLITHRFPFRDAVQAYATLQDRQALGILLEYDTVTQDQSALLRREVTLQPTPPGAELGLLGAGNFAVRTLLPALERGGNRGALAGVVSREGLAAVLAARKFGAGWAGTDPERLWRDQAVKGVFITTRHDAHAEQALAALRAGKHVWVEKPLAIDGEALRRLEESLPALGGGQTPVLMVGFNRRFAPLAVALRRALAGRPGPYEIRIVINAGRLDPEHWTLDPRVGGGRIVGEACHFVDLARFLVAAPIVSAQCRRRDTDGQDGGAFDLRFAGGSMAVIDYRTDLPAHLPKERIEVSGPGYAARLENWARLRTRGLGGLWRGAPWARTPQKGHPEALAAFRRAMAGGGPPIPTAELLEVSWWAIRLQAMRADDVVTAP